MKPNFFWFIKPLVWLVIVSAIFLLFVYPLVTGLLINAGRLPLAAAKYLSYAETAQVVLIRFLGLVWIFFLGSCFASFLNVVAWRVPRGRGINGSSHCPYCNVKLGFRDNVPIVGWLRNNGRCRNCRLPISSRYLIVEITLGFVFLILTVAQLLSGGMNLPLRAIEKLKGFENLIFDPKWDLIQLTIYHLVLICLLFTFVLIRSERLKIPVSIFVAGIVFGIGLPLIWPNMLLVSWQVGVDQLVALDRFSLNQGMSLAAGLIGGLYCGALIRWSRLRPTSGQAPDKDVQPGVKQSNYVYEGLAGLTLVGIFLGWQSAISVSILFFLISFLIKAAGSRFQGASENLSSRILLATILHLLCWRIFAWSHVWPGPTTHWSLMIASMIALAGLAILQRSFADRPVTLDHASLAIPNAEIEKDQDE